MKKLKELFIKYKEPILYIIFGGFTTVVNIVVFVVGTRILNLGTTPSNVAANILAILFAYITNKIWVFESKTETFSALMKEMTSFFAARALTFVLDLVIVYVGVNILGFIDIIVKVLSTVLVIILNYFFSKLFIFKKN